MKHYNLVQFAKDNKISTVELAEMIGIGYPTLIKHSSGQTETRKEVFNKIYEFLTKLTENPEKYSLENCPYEARKKSRNKNSKVKNYKPEEIKEYETKKEESKSKINYKVHGQKRIELEGPDEIADALIKGEIVYQDNTNFNYQILANGIVLKSTKDIPLFLNATMDMSEAYYTLEKEKIDLKEGLVYITKNNKEVIIINSGFDEFDNHPYKVAMTVGKNQLYKYSLDGKILDEEDKDLDILGEKL